MTGRAGIDRKTACRAAAGQQHAIFQLGDRAAGRLRDAGTELDCVGGSSDSGGPWLLARSPALPHTAQRGANRDASNQGKQCALESDDKRESIRVPGGEPEGVGRGILKHSETLTHQQSNHVQNAAAAAWHHKLLLISAASEIHGVFVSAGRDVETPFVEVRHSSGLCVLHLDFAAVAQSAAVVGGGLSRTAAVGCRA